MSGFDIKSRPLRLFIGLSAFFLANALVAEFMGVKIFSLNLMFGIDNLTFQFLGQQIDGMNLTCGVLLWPFVFLMTDIMNEYFGKRGVRYLSYLGAATIAYSFFMLWMAMEVPPAPWWIFSSSFGESLNYENAYDSVFGQGNAIIIGSLLAFLLSQLIDVYVFHAIKKKTGDKYIWLRSTGSTLISQLIDSFVVLTYAFYISRIGKDNQWSIQLVLAVGLLNYTYKFLVAILLTPAIYLGHSLIEKYLGKEQAEKLRQQAMQG